MQLIHHHEAGFADHFLAFNEKQQGRNGEDGEFTRNFRDVIGIRLDCFDCGEFLQHLLHLRPNRMADATVRPGNVYECQLILCDKTTDFFY